jgi:hypothetical protein
MTGKVRRERCDDKFNNLENVLSRQLWPTPTTPSGGRTVPEDAEIKGGATPTAYLNGKKYQVDLNQAVKRDFNRLHGLKEQGVISERGTTVHERGKRRIVKSRLGGMADDLAPRLDKP